MTRRRARAAAYDVLRPHSYLLRQGILATIALTTPIFAVLYWLAIPAGTWPGVLAAHMIVVFAALICVVGYFATRIRVSAGRVVERGFFGHVTVVLDDRVGEILFVDVYQGGAMETQPQLFVSDRAGALILRMRGQFWSRTNMERVAEEFDQPVTTLPAPMTIAELRAARPELLYWFERRPRFGRA